MPDTGTSGGGGVSSVVVVGEGFREVVLVSSGGKRVDVVEVRSREPLTLDAAGERWTLDWAHTAH